MDLSDPARPRPTPGAPAAPARRGRLARGLAVAAGLVVLLGGGAAFVATRTPASPFDGVDRASLGPVTPIEEASYAARLSDCVACHSVEGGAPFAGGLEMGTPLGPIHATNITPDEGTGIGGYTLADFDRAVRKGVAADGHRLYPAMPYPSYAKLSDDDVVRLYDYFTEYVEPVAQEEPANGIEGVLGWRWPIAFWNVAFARTGTWADAEGQDAAWNRGAYLVQGPGHCGACHTPRSATFAERGQDEGDAAFLAGAPLDGWYAPSLRGDADLGLGRWSEEDVVAYLRDGRNGHGVVFGSMLEAFNNSTAFMTDDDLAAVATYLKSLPPVLGEAGSDWAHDGGTTAAALASGDIRGTPAETYLTQCSYCHGRDGLGRAPFVPPLAGASSLLAPAADSAVNLTLNGAGRVVADGVPDSYRMPPYRVLLSDEEIAGVLTFVRQAWGNDGAAVTAEAVEALRERTDPSSDEVIVLQMR